MVKAEEYKGIKFVRISKLPAKQAEQITEWSRLKKITILAEEEMWRDCLQFKDYKEWYENNYQPDNTPDAPVMNEVHTHNDSGRSFSLGIMRYFYTFLQRNSS